MQRFLYRVQDAEGKQLEGILEAASETDAQKLLADYRYDILSLKEERKKMDLQGQLSRWAHVRPSNFNFFVRQLATLIGSGIPILKSLQVLQGEMKDPVLKGVIEKVVQAMEKGNGFSEAITRHPNVFNNLFIAMVRAGEAIGELDTVLLRLATVLEREAQAKAKIQAALRYPILAFSTLVVAFLTATLFIIPRFQTLFSSMNVKLPLPTRILLVLSQGVTHYWVAVSILLILTGTGLMFYVRTPSGRRWWDGSLLKIWIAGGFLRNSIYARFARMLGVMLKSGVDILRALELTSQLLGNTVLSDALMKVKEGVKEGESLAARMRREPLFPSLLVQMVNAGEESGRVDELLTQIADFYDSELEIMIKNMEALIEPVFILILAVFVVILALGIFLPIWSLYDAIQATAY